MIAEEFNLSQFEAVIFDMDGVLIDSEPLWKIVMENVFAEVGCNLTRKDFERTVGLRIDEVVAYWFTQRPWLNYSIEEVIDKIMEGMVSIISDQGKPMLGVLDALAFFQNKGLKIGVATSSYTRLLNATLDKLDIRRYLQANCSAENEALGKPHPAVFITAANQMGVEPIKCLVIEDSLNGVIAAKAARMTVICIPEPTHTPNTKLSLADFEYLNLEVLIDALSK